MTTFEAPDRLPVIRIQRDFAASRSQVYRAHVDPEIVVRWLGPRRLTMSLQRWDLRRGGGYAYTHRGEDGTEHAFWGAVHDVRADERIVQTFGYAGYPESVTLEIATFTDLGDGRSRVSITSVAPDLQTRDAMLRSGMQGGVRESHERLDEILTGGV